MNPSSPDLKWFIQQYGQVQGPFDTTSLQATLDSTDSSSLAQTLIWRRGFTEWLKASQFKISEHTQVTHIEPLKAVQSEDQFEKTKLSEKTSVASSNQLPEDTVSSSLTQSNTKASTFYRVQVSFVDQPLMTKNELLNLISKQEDISVVAIQDPHSKEWKEVYAFPDIIEKLGLSRRKHPRVPILAQFTGKSNRHENFLARIITVSEGGMGFTEVYDLTIGDEVEGQITSPHFFQPINVKADVVYSGLDGYIGLKFNQINDESQVAIFDYIKKFGKTAGMTHS